MLWYNAVLVMSNWISLNVKSVFQDFFNITLLLVSLFYLKKNQNCPVIENQNGVRLRQFKASTEKSKNSENIAQHTALHANREKKQ